MNSKKAKIWTNTENKLQYNSGTTNVKFVDKKQLKMLSF